MAEDKKGFLLYADQKELFDQLPNEKAGELIKFIFAYVNDEYPETDDLVLKLAFTPIKQQLKRDLKRYEDKIDRKSISGREGNLKRWNKDIYNDYKKGNHTLEEAENIAKSRKVSRTDILQSHPIAKIADKDNVNVTVNVKEKDINTNTIDRRKLKFASTIKEYKDSYPDEMRKDFYEYWTEPNKSNTKMRFELEKTWSLSRRLKNWAKNDKNFNNGFTSNNKPSQARTTRQQVPDEYD